MVRKGKYRIFVTIIINTMTTEEQRIVSDVTLKNREGWKLLYDYYFAALCNYTYRLSNGSELTEDLVQDIFVSLWNSSKTFDSIADLTNYLYRACYNNTLNLIRNNRIHSTILEAVLTEHEEMEEIGHELAVEEEMVRLLHIQIQQLPKEQQKIIRLRLNGGTWDEIAEELNISINTVKTQKSRVFKLLRERLKVVMEMCVLFILMSTLCHP